MAEIVCIEMRGLFMYTKLGMKQKKKSCHPCNVLEQLWTTDRSFAHSNGFPGRVYKFGPSENDPQTSELECTCSITLFNVWLLSAHILQQ
jgi:hypothetical protein